LYAGIEDPSDVADGVDSGALWTPPG